MSIRPRAAVVGTGLIGGSILTALHQADVDVIGWDPSPDARETAARLGLPFGVDLEVALKDRNLVFLCGPLSTLPETLVEVVRSTDPTCLVTDVGSTKGAIAAAAHRHGLTDRFVPGHPMAGSEGSGLHDATSALFQGAPWVLCPLDDSAMPSFRWLAQLIIRHLGARIAPLDAALHDDLVGVASHIPHVLAALLAQAAARSPMRSAVLGLAAGSFRDGTRVAGAPAGRTLDMLTSNREAVLRQLPAIRQMLGEIEDLLEANDTARLRAFLDEAWGLRQDLLARTMEPSTLSFAHNDPGERRSLTQLGADGASIVDCRATGDRVEYDVLSANL